MHHPYQKGIYRCTNWVGGLAWSHSGLTKGLKLVQTSTILLSESVLQRAQICNFLLSYLVVFFSQTCSWYFNILLAFAIVQIRSLYSLPVLQGAKICNFLWSSFSGMFCQAYGTGFLRAKFIQSGESCKAQGPLVLRMVKWQHILWRMYKLIFKLSN